MNAFCPNLSNKKVKQEFDELTSLFGEDAAYFLWDKNNGYSLDKAPNGADSILFKSLLDNYNGDRQAALKAKAKVYTSNFTNWFGDWTKEDKTDVSKVVDENGEPLVVYHATNKIFNTYKERDGIHFGSYNTALGVANEKFDPTFDTIEEAQASIAKGKFRINQVFLNIRNPKQSKDLGTGWKQLITEGFDGGLYRAVEGDTSFVVFDSNQIKSATDNVGTFSRTNDDIRYREVPNSSFESLDTEMQENLLKKGWTIEKFDSISQEERDQAVKCIAF